jgi:hypothetical protein
MSGLRVSGRASSRPPGLPERYAVSDSEHAVPLGASRCCSSWCRDASRFRLLRLDLASNFSLDEESSLRSLGDGPEPRRRSFDLGISILFDGPIRRVMYFPCLTAGDIRFLVPPLPARGVGLPYGWLTAEPRQTLSGLQRPAYARCERVGYPLYCGEVRCPHMQRHRLHAFVKGFWSLHCSPDIIVFVIHVPMTSSYAASSRVHSRSPVRSSPSPGPLCG